MIEVIIKTQTRIGKGELSGIINFLDEKEFKKPGFIIDQALKNNEFIVELIQKINDKGHSSTLYYYDLPFEPDYDSLDRVKYIFKEISDNSPKSDVLIAIGGGSVIDFSKGIATLITNHNEAIFYKGFPKNLNPSIPVIAVPSTAGTASEVTFNAVFTDTKLGRKLGINTHNNFPILAILDSNVTKDCPYSVALSSGLDALVHSFESFACKKSNYYTRIFAKEAIRYLFYNIESALTSKDNDHARENMLFGAYLAGISLYNAGSGPAGALSYPLGVICKVPHGIAGGFVLPYLIEHNVKNGYTQYAEIADVLGITDVDDLAKSQKLVKLFFELYQRLNVWEFVKKYDVKSTNPQLKEYVGQLQGAFDQNPIPFKPEDGLEIINKIFK